MKCSKYGYEVEKSWIYCPMCSKRIAKKKNIGIWFINSCFTLYKVAQDRS